MIVSGTNGKIIEVLDMNSTTTTCNNFDDYPFEIHWATGGLFLGNPLICGGSKNAQNHNDVTNECYMYDGESWDLFANMKQARREAAGVPLDEDRFWITGGVGHTTTSEFINSDRSVSDGPSIASLDGGLYGHCIVKLDCGRVILISQSKGILSRSMTHSFFKNIFCQVLSF